ncbi:hypothetical protein LMG33810_001120 [Carnimonas sp. LMG 33810]
MCQFARNIIANVQKTSIAARLCRILANCQWPNEKNATPSHKRRLALFASRPLTQLLSR